MYLLIPFEEINILFTHECYIAFRESYEKFSTPTTKRQKTEEKKIVYFQLFKYEFILFKTRYVIL